MNLSIIVPCRNEARAIESCLELLIAACPEAEILVIDGGVDETAEIVNQVATKFSQVRYIHHFPDYGKGHAIQTGIRLSRGQIICQFDADLQFRPEEICRLIAPIKIDDADMVLGSRFMTGSVRTVGSTPWMRTVGNRVLSLYASLWSGHWMTDVLAGFKAWRREVTDSFCLQSHNYSYEVELPMKALKNKWRVKDVPISTDARLVGQSSVNALRVGGKLWVDITRFGVFSAFTLDFQTSEIKR